MTFAILPCNCVVAMSIIVKCGGQKEDFKPRMAQRLFATRGIEFQEATHGKGMRVHNTRVARVQNKLKVVGHTCTVCGTKKGN